MKKKNNDGFFAHDAVGNSFYFFEFMKAVW